MTPNLHLLNHCRIVLCQTSHPGNIGSTARAMKTMGFQNLYLVQPKIFPSPESNSLASGATDILEKATVCHTLEEALAGCTFVIGLSARRRQLSHALLPIREVADRLPELLQAHTESPQNIAFVFGTEMSGLSNAELDLCQMVAMIPANPEYASLNLAAAVQIVCYELRMALLDQKDPLRDLPKSQISPQPDKTIHYASIDDIELMYEHLEQTLYSIGFLKAKEPGRIMQRLRRMFARSRLEKEEVNILRGIFKLMQSPRSNPID